MADVVSSIQTDGGGDYTSIAAWESDKDGDLVTTTLRQIGELDDDEAHDEQGNFNGSTTDSDYYFWLRGGSGNEFDHTDGSGARLVSTGKAVALIMFQSKDEYLRLGGSEGASSGAIGIKFGTTNTGDCYGVNIFNNTGHIFEQVIIYECSGGGTVYGMYGTGSGNVARNCIVYDLATTDTGTKDATAFREEPETLYNCVVYDLDAAAADDASGYSSCICYNCYAGAISAGDQAVRFLNCTGDYNSADDGATTNPPGANSLTTNEAGADQFVNVTGGSEDFHLKAGSDLIDAGNDAYSNEFDIDGSVAGARDDIGCHEYVAAGGLGIPIAMRHYLQMMGAG